jgi:hypothetical protein
MIDKITSSKKQITNNIQIRNSNKEVWNFGHCNLRFVWNLGFVIWDLIGCLGYREIKKTDPSFLSLVRA